MVEDEASDEHEGEVEPAELRRLGGFLRLGRPLYGLVDFYGWGGLYGQALGLGGRSSILRPEAEVYYFSLEDSFPWLENVLPRDFPLRHARPDGRGRGQRRARGRGRTG